MRQPCMLMCCGMNSLRVTKSVAHEGKGVFVEESLGFDNRADALVKEQILEQVTAGSTNYEVEMRLLGTINSTCPFVGGNHHGACT